VEERRLPAAGQIKPAERGLIWAIVRTPAEGAVALAELEPGDLEGLATRSILDQARCLQGCPPQSIPDALKERLSTGEIQLVDDISAAPQPPVKVLADCVVELRKRRLERERAAIERELNALLAQGGSGHDQRINELGTRRIGLKQQIEAMN
jgi:hypothetical protein